MSVLSVRLLLTCNPRYLTDCTKLISELSINCFRKDKVTKIYSLQADADIWVLKFLLSAASVRLVLLTVAIGQG